MVNKSMPEEEHREEKWHRDPLGGVFFGLLLIVIAGIYLFRAQLPLGEELWWAWIIIGIGCVFIIESAVRTIKPEYRRPSFGRAIWGIIFIAVGSWFVYGRASNFLSILIIAVGVIILIYYIRQSF